MVGPMGILHRIADRLATVASEAFGPFPVQSADDNLTAIESGIHKLRMERDEARDVARWLYQHGMATLIEGAHRNQWIKEERV